MQCVDGTCSRLTRYRVIAAIFWILAFASIPGWISVDQPGWDVTVYLNAIHSVRAGHDPYADAMAVQRLSLGFGLAYQMPTPFSYVYSPITLPLLRLIGNGPCPVEWRGVLVPLCPLRALHCVGGHASSG